MTDPRQPDGPGPETAPAALPDAATAPPPERAAEGESPTQAWPSLATPAARLDAAPASDNVYEPAASLPSTRLGTVGDDAAAGATTPTSRRRVGIRWVLAGIGILVVAIASYAIVSLVSGRPAASTAMGYMPSSTLSYTEVRLDLPGDQRTKLATFLKSFPGFDDPSAIEPKLDDVLDRIVRAATDGKQTWATNIKPWFGGQIAVGSGAPTDGLGVGAGGSMSAAANNALIAITVSDRAKATAWLTSLPDAPSLNRSTYGDADLFVPAQGNGQFAVAVNDKVMVAGTAVAVKAAIDSGGKGTFDQNDDVKAALATVDKDYVLFTVTRIRGLADAAVKAMASAQPGVLDNTQLDETILGLVPAWQASTGRFENDAIVMTSASPSWQIGYDGTNRASDLLGHAPAKAIAYLDSHDIGPALSAVLAKFRALPEAAQAFRQFDQALSLLGGFDAVFGWWGDTAFVATPLDDGTLGAGLVIHPRDATASSRLFTSLNGFLALGGASAGITTRTEDHNGTPITVIDFSASLGSSGGHLPPGYKAEFAWASNNDVAVLGYGSAFVAAVLDAGPGKSLADDPRFKGLLGRVGPDNLGVSFIDVAAIRALVEPLAKSEASASEWAAYVKDVQPYLSHLDALISNVRKDGGLDRGTGMLTAH